MKDKLGLPTVEVMKTVGLSSYKFRRVVREFNISPLKRNRGDISFRWSEEQVKLISEISKMIFQKKETISELDLIEYYVHNDVSIHKVSKKFKMNYYTVYMIIKKYEREKCVIVESKIKEYD